MARELPASKTQMRKAAEIGIDLSDQPGYTTLGARLEAAGWTKDGKTELEPGASTPASDFLAWKATPEGQMTPRQREVARQKARAAARDQHESDEDDEGRPRYAPVTTSSIHGDPMARDDA